MISLSKKVCLLGDFAVGKTSLVRRFVHNLFEDKYLSTIGVKVSRKVIAVPKGSEVIDLTMMLWDLAGSEEFDDVRLSYLRGAAGAVAVCDLTRPETLTGLQEYAQTLRAVNPAAHLIIAANKSDLAAQPLLHEERIRALAAQWAAPYYLTSAKSGENVEPLFRRLGLMLIT